MKTVSPQGVARLDKGVELAYAITRPPAGTAQPDPTPILLHRPLGGSMALWGDFAARLALFYPVITFDPRGVGRSSDVPWLYSTTDMARDAVQLLDFLEVDKAHVFGLSLGGMAASWMAISAPQRIGRMILASTLPRPGAISWHAVTRAYDFARCFALPGVQAELGLLRNILSVEFQQASPDRVHQIEDIVRRQPTKRSNLLALALAAARHNVEPELQQLQVETLLLFGELDPIARHASQVELLHDLRRSRLEILHGSGHDLSLEQPNQTADRVLEFLRNGIGDRAQPRP